jgi:hypothetical protein
MEKFIDHCCEKCTRGPDNPCKDFIRCCLEGPVCHEGADCSGKRRAIIDLVALDEQFVIC